MAEKKLDTKIRREQIAEAALSLIANQGLRRLSMAAVARRVGLVPSGIYRHFKSKNDLLAAVLDRIEQRLLANVQEALRENTDPLERIKGVLMRHIRFIREGKVISIPRMVFSEEGAGDNPELRRRVLNVFTNYIEQIVEIVRQGQTQGQIRADIDVQTVTMMIFGIIVPGGILWHLTEGDFDITRHAQRAWRLLSSAIIVPSNNLVLQECE
jgi:AcrR family transcriptional regulator